MLEEKNDFKKNDFLGPKSILNLDAQKELIDHAFKQSRKNMLKIFLILFPSIIIMVVLMVIFLIVFLGNR